MTITPQMKWAFAQWNLGVLMARQAYAADPNSTHRQRDDYTKEKRR